MTAAAPPRAEGTGAPFTLALARYARGKVAVRCLDGSNGEKGRSSRLLCAVAPSARYSRRERATICTAAQAKRFVESFARGDDGVLGERNGILDWVLERAAPPRGAAPDGPEGHHQEEE